MLTIESCGSKINQLIINVINLTYRCLVVIFFCCVSSLASTQPRELDLAKLGQSSEVEVRLVLPYPVMLRDEKPFVIVGIRNGSANTIPLVEDLGWFSTNVVSFNQLFFEVETAEGSLLPVGEMGYKPWSGILEMESFLKRDLNPGQSIVTCTPEMNLVGDWRTMDAKRARCILMVGDGLISLSNWQSVQFLQESVADHSSVEEIDYGSESRTKALMCVCEIKGQQWLFQRNQRVALVPKGSKPRYETDTKTGVMKIHFDGSGFGPVIYNARKARTVSGPDDLVPHLVAMEKVRQQIVKSTGRTKMDERGVRSVSKAVGKADHKRESGLQSHVTALLSLIGIVALGAFGVVWFKARKYRQGQ